MPSAEAARAHEIWRQTAATLSSKTALWEMRAGFERLWDQFVPPSDVTYTPVNAGGVRAEWVTPAGARQEQAILYLHGGGYVFGSIHREMVARIAMTTGLRALLLDYRLAPEHPFPTALDDALAAYRWLLGEGHARRGLVVAGDSAGGGLTVATLVAARCYGLPPAAAGVCLSPWTDLAMTGATLTTKADEDPIVSRPLLEQLATWYLGGADPRAPFASPLYADLTGLPPLLIQVGTAETLLDDARRLADRARAAGVQVTLREWEGMPHVWHFFGSFLPEARAAMEDMAAFLKQRLG
jgi:monoterpene epsilon-lactone hydrolase